MAEASDSELILLVGQTGKGKSRIVEVLCKQTGLSSTKRTKSHTEKIEIYNTSPEPTFKLMDTPGFGDSEGRDGLFINEIYQNLKKMTKGIVAVAYIKSALDRLSKHEQQSVDLLDDMFENKLFKNLIVVLTYADKEEDEEALLQTIEDHQSFFKNVVPVVPFFGRGSKVEDSKRLLMELFKKYKNEEPLITEHIKLVKCEQEKLKELEDSLLNTNDKVSKLLRELELEKAKSEHERKLREREEEAHVRYVKKKEEGLKVFTYLGKALDSGLSSVGSGLMKTPGGISNLMHAILGKLFT